MGIDLFGRHKSGVNGILSANVVSNIKSRLQSLLEEFLKNISLFLLVIRFHIDILIYLVVMAII